MSAYQNLLTYRNRSKFSPKIPVSKVILAEKYILFIWYADTHSNHVPETAEMVPKQKMVDHGSIPTFTQCLLSVIAPLTLQAELRQGLAAHKNVIDSNKSAPNSNLESKQMEMGIS